MGAGSRKKLRQKERRLSEFGEVNYWRAETADEIDRVLTTFFSQKARRMAELGLANVFAEGGVDRFITAAARRKSGDGRTGAIELYAMSIGDEVVATMGGVVASGRFCGMFNSMSGQPYRAYSPGELLLSNVVRMSCDRGLERFDLGVGDAAYKAIFCSDVEPQFDSVIPITPLGRAIAPVWKASLSAKRQLKKSDRLLHTYHFIRRQFVGRDA